MFTWHALVESSAITNFRQRIPAVTIAFIYVDVILQDHNCSVRLTKGYNFLALVMKDWNCLETLLAWFCFFCKEYIKQQPYKAALFNTCIFGARSISLNPRQFHECSVS